MKAWTPKTGDQQHMGPQYSSLATAQQWHLGHFDGWELTQKDTSIARQNQQTCKGPILLAISQRNQPPTTHGPKVHNNKQIRHTDCEGADPERQQVQVGRRLHGRCGIAPDDPLVLEQVVLLRAHHRPRTAQPAGDTNKNEESVRRWQCILGANPAADSPPQTSANRRHRTISR